MELSTGYTRREWCILVTLSAATFTTALCASLQAPFYPSEAEKKGATASEYGFVFGIFELTVFISSPFFGKYMGKIGVSFALKFGMLIAGVSVVLFGLLDMVEGHWTFISLSLLVRVLESLGTAAVVTSSLSIVVIIFADSFAKVFSTLEVLQGVGYMVGPTVGGFLFEVGGFRFPFLMVGGFVLLTAVFLLLMLPKLNDMDGRYNPRVPIMSVLKVPAVAMSAICLTMEALSVGFLTATLEPHLRQFNLSPTALGSMFVISGAVYTCTAPFVGILCDRRLNTRIMIIFGSLFVIGGYLLLGPVPFTPFKTTLLEVGFGLVLDGLGMSLIFVPAFVQAIVAASENGLPDDISTFAIVSGIYASSFALGSFIGPSVSGLLYDHFGFRPSTLFIIVVHLLLAVMMLVYMCIERWEGRRRQRPDLKPRYDDLMTSTEYVESQTLLFHARISSHTPSDKLFRLQDYNTIGRHSVEVYAT